MLDPTTLRVWARVLIDASHSLSESMARSQQDAAKLPRLGFLGEASTSAVLQLTHHSDRWRTPQQELLQAAAILETAAHLQDMLNVAVALADYHSHSAMARPFVDSLYRFIQVNALHLDRMTARALSGLPLDPVPDHSHHLDEVALAHPDVDIVPHPHGGMVATIGDLSTAQSIVTFVPGTGSGDPESWSHQISTGKELATAVDGAAVVWIGYDPPPTVLAAVDPGPARQGGAELAAFQRHLDQSYPAATKTVVGYSYGAVVVGHAGQRDHGGLAARNVVFVGAPGTGVNSAQDLVLLGENPQVHAVTIPGDPISLTTSPAAGVHGPDPTAPDFGATVWPRVQFGHHTSYFSSPEFYEELGRRVAH